MNEWIKRTAGADESFRAHSCKNLGKNRQMDGIVESK
jgi:hypothetical protein